MMSGELNKKLLFENITFLLREKGMKIGELEKEAGVSPGYISRSKDGTSKPGIEFIMKVAEVLDVSVDTLLNVNLNSLTPTEWYLITFIEKLKEDTVEDKLDWRRNSADSYNRLEADINGFVDHPLFSFEDFYEAGPAEYPERVQRVVFVSHSFDCHTYINNDCFSLRMKNGAILFLMNISKSAYKITDPDAFAKEIWMCRPGGGASYLCSNRDISPLAVLVDDLYTVVKEFSKHPKINKDLKYIIDAFMKDDLDDDDNGEFLPF